MAFPGESKNFYRVKIEEHITYYQEVSLAAAVRFRNLEEQPDQSPASSLLQSKRDVIGDIKWLFYWKFYLVCSSGH